MDKEKFVLRKSMKIGSPAAEDDEELLAKCFVDTGDLELLQSTSRRESVVLGRTGAGKSALLRTLASNREHCIFIDPEQDLALGYLSNSTVLRFFEALGVNLDIFYNLLWRHVLAVELIKHRYGVHNETSKRSLIARWNDFIAEDPAKKQALAYFETWGGSFWLETETRVKEITEKMEQTLKAAIGGAQIPASLEAVDAMSAEVKSELRYNAQKVVNEVQIKQLNKLIELLGIWEFQDEQRCYYLLVDKLDERWVDDQLRYRLIRALIETIKAFRKLPTVKIVIALRADLLGRVLAATQDSGFQFEKYEDYLLTVAWTKEQLTELLERRINHVFQYQYRSGSMKFHDIFPNKTDGVDTVDYILSRTLMRPRDAIMFVNACIHASDNKPRISPNDIFRAEVDYSNKRLESLCYEWHAEYPLLGSYLSFLRGKGHTFDLQSMLDKDGFSKFLTDTYDAALKARDPMAALVERYLADRMSIDDCCREFVAALYKTGCIGVKFDSVSSVMYCQLARPALDTQRLNYKSRVYVQKMLWGALQINQKSGL